MFHPETLFRHRTKKTVELTKQGNFVVEIPVPEKLLSFGLIKTGREFTHLRYTAVTGDPNEFRDKGFTLRQNEMGRHTEIFIVATMYNEDEVLFAKTWKAIAKNIAYLCQKKKSSVWGPDGWKKVTVCIVSDGRNKINQRTLQTIGIMGAYQEGLVKTSVEGQEVSAHLFEYTTQICVDPDMRIRGTDSGLVPVQILFCLKEKNAKKINSHRWFFNAFGQVLNPHVCILLDVGTKPTEKSFYRLWKAFDSDPMVAGACGEIYADTGRFNHKVLLNPLVAAQNFEYKMSNILDKPLESVFGFISVLPGAFSAYRYRALQNGPDGTGPLEKYFMGEKMHGGANIRMANMYLAEDRILCFELVTKRDEAWLLKYVRSAKAETDVPDTLPEFISQRRRWLNGSFFAGLHALLNFFQVFRSGHNVIRKFVLMFEMLYNLVQLLFSWFQLGNLYLIFHYLVGDSATSPDGPFPGNAGDIVFRVLNALYLAAIVLIFISSLGNRPQGSKWLFMLCVVFFAIIMVFMLFLAVWTMVILSRAAAQDFTGSLFGTNSSFRDLVISLLSTYGLYLIGSILFLDPLHMLTCLIQYLVVSVMSGTNILMVYAFCNLHDVSWGTKGDNVITADAAPVKTKKTESGNRVATVDLPVEQRDIDAVYELFLHELPNRPKQEKQHRDAKLKQEDFFRAFRTRVVLFWVFCNAVLIVCLLPPVTNFSRYNNPYLAVILWSVAGLSAIRLIGSVLYLIRR
ncbi:hypothetical protein CXG81DRAFT_12399 [Caulochytrium protostelioides]|uniref:Chitin synthase n=1 Tax=Caulochytrium protostelioides TaxID=1555241 RepID=A0A4P9X795_9FUNG|nr:hypothetical protein CXG81DRAFT_12399 [Caulochytrium protostelioides]|eukprot:RKP01104.1 hypothetical protein CXG81DRAFT_12399 [Caulochytrium protostelioides]